MKRWALAAMLMAVELGCDRSIQDKITIEQGIYGVAISYSDIAGVDNSYVDGMAVELYRSGETESGSPVGSAVTDGDGFFEISAQPGSYELCDVAYNGLDCLAVELGEGLLHCDFGAGVGGGWWECGS